MLPALARLEQGDENARLACAALRAGLYLAGHAEGRPLGAGNWLHTRNEAAPYARLFATFQARLSGDLDALALYAQRPTFSSALAGLSSQLAGAWLALWRGQTCEDAVLASAEIKAKEAGFGDLSVDFLVLRALSFSAQGSFEQALRLARRASRMGHTEHRPQSEYAAHIALARARRHAGMPYLSARILRSLSEVLPVPWQAWSQIELELSGGTSEPNLTRPQSRGWMRVELADAQACLHGDVSKASPAARRWLEGHDSLPPWGIHALAGDEIGYVVLAPEQRAVRCLARPSPERGAQLETTNEPRTERGLVALAFSKSRRLTLEDFFLEVYGFAFDPGLHGAWLRTLLMRMRKACEGVATIERDDGGLRMVARRPFVFRDPRCVLEPSEQVLQLIAKRGGMSARQAAGTLGVPLRSVQRTLKSLVDEGVCQADRSSRQVVYTIEDTTFHEPTDSYRVNLSR